MMSRETYDHYPQTLERNTMGDPPTWQAPPRTLLPARVTFMQWTLASASVHQIYVDHVPTVQVIAGQIRDQDFARLSPERNHDS